MTPRVGFVLGPESSCLTRAEAAALEATGCDSLWVGGHVTSRESASEVVTSLARLAALTERVSLGSAVIVLPAHSPVVVAKQFAEIDRASGGRVVLGVGSGSDAVELAACGASFAGRGAVMDESIEVIRALWRGEQVTRVAPFGKLDNATIRPAPNRPDRLAGPPIIVAGRKPAAMRRAARLGDGWLPSLYSPGGYARSVEQVTGYAAEAGRALDGFDWSCLVYVRIDDDGATALDRAATVVSGEMGLDHADAVPIVQRTAAVGRPDEVARALRRYVDAGVTQLLVRVCAGGDAAEQARRMMSEVAPLLTAVGAPSANIPVPAI